MSISIIIVTYNNQHQIKACINSIVEEIHHIDGEIIIIDNNSTDQTKKEIDTLHLSERILKSIYNKNNKGYARANNQGISIAKNKTLFFLNPDTFMSKGTLSILMNRLTVNNKLAAIAPQLIYPNGSIQPSCRRFPTHPLLFFELFGLSKFKCIKGWKMNDFNHNEECIVDQPMGAALMIKLDILRQLNGFDENFPMFFNDVDICRRIYLLGKEILFYPKVVITHEKGVSIKQKQLIMIISSQLSFLKYFIKHFPQPKYLLLNIIIMVLLLFNLPIRIVTQYIKIKIN